MGMGDTKPNTARYTVWGALIALLLSALFMPCLLAVAALESPARFVALASFAAVSLGGFTGFLIAHFAVRDKL